MSGNNRFKWPEKLNIINWWGVGADSSRSWGELLQADTGMKVRVAGEYDTVHRFRWMNLGLFDLTGGAASETKQMLAAEERFAQRDGGPFQIRAVWVHSKENAAFFTRGDSKIKTPHDIKPGTRIAYLTGMASCRVIEGVVFWAGLESKDIDWVPAGSLTENWELVVEGRADICFGFPTCPTIREMAKNPYGIDLVQLNAKEDPEGAKRFKEHDPYYLVNFGIIPAYDISGVGVKAAAGKWGTEGICIEETHERTDPELVYHLVKWMDKNYDRYKARHPQNEFRTREWLMKGLELTYLPCHEGLIKYLKELGLWTAAHERRQKKNLDLITRYCEAYQKVMAEADEKWIPVMEKNKEWLDLWENYKAANLPPIRLFNNLEED